MPPPFRVSFVLFCAVRAFLFLRIYLRQAAKDGHDAVHALGGDVLIGAVEAPAARAEVGAGAAPARRVPRRPSRRARGSRQAPCPRRVWPRGRCPPGGCARADGLVHIAVAVRYLDRDRAGAVLLVQRRGCVEHGALARFEHGRVVVAQDIARDGAFAAGVNVRQVVEALATRRCRAASPRQGRRS